MIQIVGVMVSVFFFLVLTKPLAWKAMDTGYKLFFVLPLLVAVAWVSVAIFVGVGVANILHAL
jgi:hypothetical protein